MTAGRASLGLRCLAAGLAPVLGTASAQAQAPERTIKEIAAEAQAERGNHPLIGLDPADVRDALAAIHVRCGAQPLCPPSAA